jgi:hypothetical protein
MRIGITLVAILAICGSIWFFAGEHRWDALMTLATLAAVVAAIFLDEIRTFYHRPEIDVYVGDDLIDRTSFPNLLWVRGKIKNIGDRGVERCRLKLLAVQGHNIQAGRIENGFLQWQGGIRDSMRLNPDEYWIFDIGSRARQQNSAVNLLAHFCWRRFTPRCPSARKLQVGPRRLWRQSSVKTTTRLPYNRSSTRRYSTFVDIA